MNGSSGVMRAVDSLLMVGALGVMVLATPLLDEATRGPVAALVSSRYDYSTAKLILTGYSIALWPAAFVVTKAPGTLIFAAVAFHVARRTYSP